MMIWRRIKLLWLQLRLCLVNWRIDRNIERGGWRWSWIRMRWEPSIVYVPRPMTLTSFDAIMCGRYSEPGARMKLYIVDEQREREWAEQTCPRVRIGLHCDVDGDPCANSGDVPWISLEQNQYQCDECARAYHHGAKLDRVVAWLVERDKRPPICADRTKLSDKIAPSIALANSPILSFIRRPA